MAGTRVNLGDLGNAVSSILEQYVDSVDEVVKDAVDKTAQETVNELKQTSPKKTGAYAKGWKKKTEQKRTGTGSTVYNTNPGLPHLLEKGHANRNGGRTLGHPHIAPAEEHAIQRLEERIRDGV